MPRVNVKDKRRQQLMEANMASIARRGFTETTIAHVSQGANMSRGIVNFYFTSKEIMMQETLRYLCEEFTNHWHDALERAKEKKANKEKTESYASPEELLQTLIDANFDSKVCSHKRLAIWAAFWGHASTHKAYSKIIQACDELHISAIAELWDLVAAGAGGKKKAQSNFPQQLHSMLRGMWLMLLLEPDIYDAKSLHTMAQRALHEKIEFVTGASIQEAKASLVTDKAVQKKKPAEKKSKQAEKVKDISTDKRQIDMFGNLV
jgi:AcrR family transcriptional regulator